MSEASRVGDGLRRSLRNTARRVLLAVHARLDDTTPVDTGFAVTNWVPSVGEPFQGLAGTRTQAEEGRLDLGPKQAGLAAVRAYELSQGDLFDTNNVHYVEDLNGGSSSKAPAAFVQAAIVGGIEDAGHSAIRTGES